jgi:hypothetical protein
MTSLYGITDTVQAALDTIERPYHRDVTDRVFLAIAGNPAWLRWYEDLVAERTVAVVNRRIGFMVRQLTGLQNLGTQGRPRSRLIKTYTELGPQ